MKSTVTHRLPEKHESLWWLAAAPTLWAAHFLLSYVTAAIWCAKFAPHDGTPGTLSPVRWAIAGYTVVALVGIGWLGRHGLRRHRRGTESTPHDFDTAGDRHGFLGYATVLLSALSAVAVIFAALVVAFFEDCR
jgi:hypothetical protein